MLARLVWGLLGGLVGGLTDALIRGKIEIKTLPNEGIKRSARHALVVGLAWGLIAGLLWGLVDGLFSGLLTGLLFGGHAYLQHFVLRFLLWGYNYAPLNYVHFLDYAAERLFLRKVGGGYIFIHRMLLEYFASREPEAGKARPT